MNTIYTAIFTVILGVCSTSSNNENPRINPVSNSYYVKSSNIPEDGFFDPQSYDLEQAFSTFLTNTHPLYKPTDIPYLLTNTNQLYLDKETVDLDVYENCLMINSHWASKGTSDNEIEPLLKAFWEGIGVFNYIQHDGNKWVEVFEDDKRDNEVKNNHKKSNKKKNKKKSTVNSTSTANSSKICALMSPDLKLLRETLEHPVCQRTIQIAISVLTPSQVATFFQNAPIDILDNPGILDCIEDFTGFELGGGEAVEKLAKIFEDKRYVINLAMAKTLALPVLHRIIEAKNFDLSFTELNHLIFNRPGFESQEPFYLDHRTFRIFSSDSPLFGLPPADLILKSIESSSGEDGLSADLIESILAFYIRSEFGVNSQVSWIHDNLDNLELVGHSVDNLINLFSERNRIILALNSVDEKLAKFIRIPLNQLMRSDTRDGPLKSTWNYLTIDPIIVDKISVLRSTISYFKKEMDVFDIFGQWNEITERVSEAFRKGRWARNFLQSLLFVSETKTEPGAVGYETEPVGHETEKAVTDTCTDPANDSEPATVNNSETANFVDILSRHLGPREYPNFTLKKFGWFLLPLADVLKTFALDGSSQNGGVLWSYKVAREATKILWNVNFFEEGVIDAIWRDEYAMNVIISFPFCLNQGHVDALVQTGVGKELLKANPILLNRLPSYANFTLEDLEEFNLNLDDFVDNIGTLNVEVAKEWLKKKEFLVNNPTRALYRPHMTIHTDFDSWSLVTFEALRAAPSLAKDLKLIDSLNLSNHLKNTMDITEKLSLISRWLVHIEIQSAWMWLLSRLPYFNTESMSIAVETFMFVQLETFEFPRIIKKLKKDFEKEVDFEKKKMIRDMMVILKEDTRMISSFKAQVKGIVGVSYERVKADNDFICSLILAGPGSDKFKRIWLHRAHLLIYPTLDIKTLIPFETASSAKSGLIPLDDALLQWFIENKKTVDAMKIGALVKLQRGQEVNKLEKEQNKYADWLNKLVPVELIK